MSHEDMIHTLQGRRKFSLWCFVRAAFLLLRRIVFPAQEGKKGAENKLLRNTNQKPSVNSVDCSRPKTK